MAQDSASQDLTAQRRSPRWWRRTLVMARRANLLRWIEALSAVVLCVMVVATYRTVAGASSSTSLLPAEQSAALLLGTLIPALALIIFVGRRLAIRRSGNAMGRMHVNLVFFFSLVAAIPTLLVAVFASLLFQSGVEFWFSDNSRGMLQTANELARGYYDQNQRDVGNQTLAMASDLRFYIYEENKPITSVEFGEGYSYQALSRELSESAILEQTQGGGLRIAAIVDPDEDETRERVSADTLDRLRAGEDVVVIASPERIEAIAPINRQTGLYLYNARNSDTNALSQWKRAQSVAASYEVLTRRARALQLRFNLALFGVSLALVGMAVWFALRFADRQVKPLTELVSAAREVGSGNYALRVTGRTGPDEIGLVNRAFNRMTSQIERQTDALLGANRQLAERRAFMEAVLQSITAGIVSINAGGNVQLMNASARDLLLDSSAGRPEEGVNLADIAPQIATLWESGASSGIVQYSKVGELLTLAVKIAAAAEGHVITFEDITRQLLDQRQAAWSDVARRIAHEIKNPLTPIQLATERIKRRYRKQILEDGELFEDLTATIIRQVGDLRKMVDEFSSFARLPKPVFRPEDAVSLVRQAMFLQEVGHQDIAYRAQADDGILPIQADRHQFGQAMTNVLKNAAEAIEARGRDAEPDYRGMILVEMNQTDSQFIVSVTDNGIGLPQGGERIMEPYVTTREKGTGLGLAIVKKIVEEHGGDLAFAQTEHGGARVILRFARDPLAAGQNGEAAE